MFSALYLLAFVQFLHIVARATPLARSLTDKCYYDPLPSIPVSNANRTIPWGQPTIQYANGTTCCSSLDEVRDALDTVDAQLLQLLSTRASYVREATRFKNTEASVDDPSRNQQVIQGAIDGAAAVHLPQIVAKLVYESIINASILFEDCVFDTYMGSS
ncbi:hypothetical protein HYDPIDRAFT_110220 [Hydnomerulius pinastri MD-312]|nr:hypothetical protein HYDPIDRAFT_110220 [Hydnomerulius pinastri MD-312]